MVKLVILGIYLAYVLLIFIVVVMALTIYTNASKESEDSQKEKIFSEIKYMETQIVNLFNSMNNIQSRNYSMITSELSKETTEKETNNGGSNGSSSGNQDTLSQDQPRRKQ